MTTDNANILEEGCMLHLHVHGEDGSVVDSLFVVLKDFDMDVIIDEILAKHPTEDEHVLPHFMTKHLIDNGFVEAAPEDYAHQEGDELPVGGVLYLGTSPVTIEKDGYRILKPFRMQDIVEQVPDVRTAPSPQASTQCLVQYLITEGYVAPVEKPAVLI